MLHAMGSDEQDPQLAAMGHRFTDELRAEQAAYEALAAKDRLRHQSLADVALELVHRGDSVAVAAGPRGFNGTLVYAAGDLACLRTATADVDLNLTAQLVLRVTERVRSGGVSRTGGAGSFLARLREHEAASGVVELGGPTLSTDLRGAIEAVAHDHVVLHDLDSTWHVPIGAIAYVLVTRA